MPRRPDKAAGPAAGRPVRKATGTSLNRIFSKLGIASRSEADRLIRAGRVTVNGRCITDPELRVDMEAVAVALDGERISAQAPVYLMVNKPRGLVTTLSDPEGRETIYRCLEGMDLPHVSPVGRLDKASEGLILMTNDTLFAQALLDPQTGPQKLYHVQVDRVPDAQELARMVRGVEDRGDLLSAASAILLRSGGRTAWLEIALDEGRNRQIRRLLGALGIDVLRLVRVAIGPLALGTLGKGEARHLTSGERAALGIGGNSSHPTREPEFR